MSITYTNTPKNSTLVTLEYVNPCTLKYMTTSSLLQESYINDADYDKERRIRPVNYALSPTARPGITRQVKVRGEWLRAYSAKPAGCTRYANYIARGRFDPSVAWPTAPQPDWAQKTRNKIKGLSVSFAEAIGEYKESIEMLLDGTHIIKRAWDTARYLWRNRRYRRRVFHRLWKTGILGNYQDGEARKFIWHDVVAMDLAIKFGIIPMSTLLDDTLTRMAAPNQFLKKRVRTSVREDIDKIIVGTYSGEARMRVTTKVNVDLIVTFADPPQFTSGNLLEAVWAGTRLSFMVDWFLNVGSYLSSLDAMNAVAGLVGTRTTRTRRMCTDTRTPYVDARITKPGTVRNVQYQRDIVTGIPLPSKVNWRGGNGAEWGKLLSAMEILASLIHGRKTFP